MLPGSKKPRLAWPAPTLFDVWRCVPQLLEACTDDSNASRIQELRLISEEASRVAILALRCYQLRFTWEQQVLDTNLGGLRLLRTCRLNVLKIVLTIQGACKLAIMILLENFNYACSISRWRSSLTVYKICKLFWLESTGVPPGEAPPNSLNIPQAE